jgi:hypothetical protein
MTTTEAAAEIRAQLKRKGWTSRQVSVRAEQFSMGSAINVLVKDPAVPLQPVRDAAEPHEHIRRCEVTGEILGGGNRYLSVRYSSEALEVIGRRYADAVQRAVNQASGTSLIPVEGTEFFVGLPPEYQHQNSMRITLWRGDGYVTDCYTVEAAAQVIGQTLNR